MDFDTILLRSDKEREWFDQVKTAEKRRKKAMNSTDTSPGCEADLILGGSLTVAALIFIITIQILIFPFTAVLNALVMNAINVSAFCTCVHL